MKYKLNAKSFPIHKDAHGFYPDPDLPLDTIKDIENKGQESAVAAMHAEGTLHTPASRTLYHKVTANFNDPIAVYYVLDALCVSQRGLYLRPVYVAHYLRERAPQFYWSPSLVGRIMAGLWHTCKLAYLDPAGEEFVDLEMEEEDREKHVPYARGRDSQGKYYIIDPDGGDEGLLWLLIARKRFFSMGVQSMHDDTRGEPGLNWGKEKAPTDFYMAVMPGPARNAQAYKLNSRPGQPFLRQRVEVVREEPRFEK